jgi:DNA repair protein SbcD/Mre11
VKVVHTADLHIGLETHGPMNPQTGLPRRLEDFLVSLDHIVDRALAEQADLVIMAGDIYKGRDPTPTHQQLFARRIRRLVQANIPVMMLTGNHDLPNAVSRATSIDIFRDLEIAGVTVARTPSLRTIETRSGPVLIGALPWITRSTVLAQEGARSLTAEELEAEMVEMIARLATELAEAVEARRLESGFGNAPAILVAHVHAKEARDGAERMLTVGNDPLVPIDRLAIAPFDYVAMGHIHAHQVLARKPPAIYPGSIERVNFGEEREEKGFVVAEVTAGSCEWEFVPLPARRFVTVDVDAPTDDPTETTVRQIERRAAEIPDSVVRVRVQVSPQNMALFNESRIREALEPAFWVAQVSREVQRTTRTRIAGLAVHEKGPLALLEDYFTEKELPPDERERLRSYAIRLVQRADSA